MTDGGPPQAPSPDAIPRRQAVPGRPPMRTPAAPDGGARAARALSRRRLVMAASGFGLLFGAVALKLADATLFDPVAPRRINSLSRPVVAAPLVTVSRGAITDRNGEMLAVSLPVTALYANPRQIENPADVAARLARVLPQLDVERVTARLSTDRQFAYLARALTPREMATINTLGIPGIYFEDAERRYYPQGRAAVHALGAVDVDGNGVAGVERYFDERLRLRNSETLRLSIDVRVQLALREALGRAIADFNGIGGAGVVMDVRTGEVLGMISLPDFDQNDIGSATVEQRFNRVTVGVYEPGSTFKLFTTAMALEAGTTTVMGGYDASSPIRYGRFTISDYRGKGRWLALPEILAYSSNIASAHMAAAVGPVRHRAFMGAAGMLARQHIELPEVATPLAPTASGWRDINTLTVGFGHGISVTPLHVVNGAAALVNGGILRQPTILAVPPGEEREGVRLVSERTSDTLRRLMRLVVTEGSGRSADVPGYFVGGKTGTAQKTGPRGGYLANKRIAAFVGAFPMYAPRYAVYVMVDEPSANARSHGFATAGWVAAPAANMVISRIAPILGLVPEDPRNPEMITATAMPLQPRRTGAPPTATARATTPGSGEPTAAVTAMNAAIANTPAARAAAAARAEAAGAAAPQAPAAQAAVPAAAAPRAASATPAPARAARPAPTPPRAAQGPDATGQASTGRTASPRNGPPSVQTPPTGTLPPPVPLIPSTPLRLTSGPMAATPRPAMLPPAEAMRDPR
ncbi:peptidoglycan D,D-transpeptidase FtsI family protein [Humitalea sp. 24SJ18S-53]|uniref:peptidoglycan D,D-transpeptidase FtsI family protein n=1 Tax=Humitalea sp. 24SJ18S-53 TaxID=3422307 RepID=UPI003D672AE4